jgi:hypothetical protein
MGELECSATSAIAVNFPKDLEFDPEEKQHYTA